ncbi:hypothetical protein ACFL08_00900 [Patescibacteria group bacterium]
MTQDQIEQKQKDQILQEIHNELEMQDWGGNYDKVILRVAFKGKLNILPIELNLRK